MALRQADAGFYPDGAAARQAIRAGMLRRPTAGIAPGYVQANLVVLPDALARDFLRFCQLNPKACPVLDVTRKGSPHPDSRWASAADLRSDLPRYRVYRAGELVDEPENLFALWQDDFVSFLLGCSFTFEQALLESGISIRHIELGRNVPMYRTKLLCEPAGIFAGPLVVSMRPIPDNLVERAIAVTARYPAVHGAPVHVGDPSYLGIEDINHPDYGDAVPVYPGETPVFWACGVTPQAAAQASRVPLMITHAPGHMFITDRLNVEMGEG